MRASNLTSLIRALDEADSPFEKLHQLALAWRSVRALAPEERRELARQAGFDGAEGLVEQLATRRGGLAPALLLQAVERARHADSSQLREIFRRLHDPKSRGDVVRQGARVAAEAVLDRTVAAPEDRAAGDENDPGGLDHGRPPDPAGGAVQPPGPEAPVSGQDQSEVVGGMAAADVPEPEPPARVETAEVAPDEVEGALRAAQVVDEPPGTGEPALVEGHGRDREADAAPEVAAVSGAADRPETIDHREPGSGVGSLVSRLAAEPDDLRRLRLLRETELPVLRAAVEAERVLDQFTWRWAKRRALCRLVQGGALDGVPNPEEIIRGLPHGDRLWCVAAIVRHGLAASADIGALVGCIESPALRSRLLGLAAAAASPHFSPLREAKRGRRR